MTLSDPLSSPIMKNQKYMFTYGFILTPLGKDYIPESSAKSRKRDFEILLPRSEGKFYDVFPKWTFETMKRVIRKASELIYFALFIIIFLAGSQYLKDNSPNANDAKLIEIQQISK